MITSSGNQKRSSSFPFAFSLQSFGGKFLALLKEKLPDTDKTVLNACYTRKWVVYCKQPFASADKVMSYLGRYTHRVAISNNRIMDMQDGKITFRWWDCADGLPQPHSPCRRDLQSHRPQAYHSVFLYYGSPEWSHTAEKH